jgi:rubrerythrin
MTDAPLTASAIVSFTQSLEERSADFYRDLAARFPEQARTFNDYARADEKYETQITRTYQETVTDALETGYSFEGLSLTDYQIALELPEGAELSQAAKVAVELEQTATAFYEEVAERSQALLATIPSAFRRVAKRRRRRIPDLEAMAQ